MEAPPVSSDYDRAVEAWLGESDPDKARRDYRNAVFPLARERMRGYADPIDLLIVPVGTQPFAPGLAVVSTPARCVVLLHSPESAAVAREVEAVCEGAVVVRTRIDAVDVAAMGQRLRDIYETRGLPPGSRVAADITGGRKTMTAAVAGTASLLGWRMFYIEGIQVREKDGYTHHERLVELPSLLDILGTRKRDEALTLLRAGQCAAAERTLLALISDSPASAHERKLLSLVRAAGALRQADVARLTRHLPATWRLLGRAPDAPLLARLRAGEAEVVRELRALAAAIRRHEGDRLGAACLGSGRVGAALRRLDQQIGRGIGNTLTELS